MDFVKHVKRDDDLDKKKSVKVKKKVHFESNIESNQIKPAVQLKILMRKEEAARLLSKSQNGVLQFQDLLLHIPTNPFSSNKKDK